MSNDLELKLVLRASDQGLSGAVRQVKDETQALDSSLDKVAKSSGHFADKLSETDRAAGRSYDKLGRLREANGRFVAGAKNATDETGKLNQKLGDNAQKAKKASAESQGFSKTLKDGAAKAGAWAMAITGAVAVATSFATTLRTDAIRESQVLAETLGTNVQALSEWEYAAGQVNVSGEKVGDIFKDVSDKIGDFITTGGGEAADLFENLNLQVSDLINLSPDQQLLAIGDALDDVDNRGQQIFFLESLADDASRLLPLLENDAAELKRLQLEAQVLGVSLNDIDAAKVTQAAQAFDRVQGLATGTANDLTIELAPILGGIADLWVDNAVEAGGYRDTVRNVIDATVTGVGFVLDVGQQLHVLLKYSEQGWLMIGQAGTSAMASVADATASLINTALSPLQDWLSWIIKRYAQWMELVSRIGGPLADNIKDASDWLKSFGDDVADFSVGAHDIISLNERMSQALINSSNELEALLNAGASSDELKAAVAAWREESEEAAKAQTKLGRETKTTGTIVSNQVDTYADLVSELEGELELLQLGNRDREIEIALRKLDADATDQQKDKIRELAGALFDYKEELKANEAAAKVWSDITDNAIKSVDDSFRELFRSGLDGWDDFWDQMKNTAKNMVAELAYTLAKEKLWVNVGLNVTGQGGTAAGSPGASGITGGTNPLSTVFNNSLSYPISNAINQGASAVFSNAAYAVNNPALVNNIASIKSGAVSVSSPASQLVGGAAAGLGAYGFAQQYGIAGGVAGGVGTSMLTGGITSALGGGGFLSGATGALSGLGPVGWAAIGIGALLGGLGKKPSDKTQWAGFTGADNAAFVGGFEGKKYSEENRSAATQMAAVLNTFNQALDQFSGSDYRTAMQVQVGSRDGIFVRTADNEYTDELNRNESGTSASVAGGYDIYSGTDPEEALESAIEFMAQQHGVVLDIYKELSTENELLGDTYVRLQQQQQLVSVSLDGLGIPFNALGDDALRIADGLIRASGGMDAFVNANEFYYQNFYTEQERAQRLVDQYTGVLDGFNQQFDTAIDSRDDLRAFVESLDLTTEAGQNAYAAALQLAPALVGLESASAAATDSVETVDDSLQSLGMTAEEIAEGVNNATNAYLAAFGTAEQRFSALSSTVHSEAEALGFVLPDTRAGFVALAEGIDWSTDANQGLAAALADLIPLFDEYYTAIEDQQALIATQANSTASAYLAAFGTEEQKFDALAQHAQSIADAYSVDLPATREDFRALIESVDWSTDAGQQLAADLADAVPVFAAYYDTLEARSSAVDDTTTDHASLSDIELSYYEERALAIADNYELELDEINRTHQARLDALEEERRVGLSLIGAYQSLLLSDLSPLTPAQRLQEAQQQFAALQVRAEAGDIDAAAQLESVAVTYLREASSYYASGSQYQRIFGEVTGVLNSLGGSLSSDDRIAAAQSQIHSDQLRAQQSLLASSRSQLNILAQSYTELSGVEEDTNTMVELMRGLPGNLASALQGILPDEVVATVSGGGTEISDLNIREHVASLEADGLSGLALERRVYRDAVRHGVGSAQLERAMGWSAGTVADWMNANPDVVSAFGDLPQFADGGHHSGGYAIVGERGPELAWFDGPAQIYTAEQTQSMLGGDSLHALLQELAALRHEVAQLRTERSRDAVTAEQQRERQITRGRQKQRLEAIS